MSELINYYSHWSHQKTMGFFYDFRGVEVIQLAEICLFLVVKFGGKWTALVFDHFENFFGRNWIRERFWWRLRARFNKVRVRCRRKRRKRNTYMVSKVAACNMEIHGRSLFVSQSEGTISSLVFLLFFRKAKFQVKEVSCS